MLFCSQFLNNQIIIFSGVSFAVTWQELDVQTLALASHNQHLSHLVLLIFLSFIH